MAGDRDFRRGRVRLFESRLDAEPVLWIDNREIVAALGIGVGGHLAGAWASFSVPSASTTTVHERAR